MYHQRRLGAIYQSGRRFGLGDWTAAEWAQFFTAAEPSAAQLYATVAGVPVATASVPVETVATPIGAVPAWGIIAAIGLLGIVLLTRKGR